MIDLDQPATIEFDSTDDVATVPLNRAGQVEQLQQDDGRRTSRGVA